MVVVAHLAQLVWKHKDDDDDDFGQEEWYKKWKWSVHSTQVSPLPPQ